MVAKYISILISYLRKKQAVLVWLMSAWFAHSLIKNGLIKFYEDGFWTNAFSEWGYPVWFRILIGILEVGGGVLLLIPRTRLVGGLILCVIMLGALGTRLTFGTGYDDAIYLAFAAISFLFFASYTGNEKTDLPLNA